MRDGGGDGDARQERPCIYCFMPVELDELPLEHDPLVAAAHVECRPRDEDDSRRERGGATWRRQRISAVTERLTARRESGIARYVQSDMG